MSPPKDDILHFLLSQLLFHKVYFIITDPCQRGVCVFVCVCPSFISMSASVLITCHLPSCSTSSAFTLVVYEIAQQEVGRRVRVCTCVCVFHWQCHTLVYQKWLTCGDHFTCDTLCNRCLLITGVKLTQHWSLSYVFISVESWDQDWYMQLISILTFSETCSRDFIRNDTLVPGRSKFWRQGKMSTIVFTAATVGTGTELETPIICLIMLHFETKKELVMLAVRNRGTASSCLASWLNNRANS